MKKTATNHLQRPNGLQKTITIILFYLSFPVFPQIVITEIQRDPAGSETASPGGASHEFVEITNFGVDTANLDSLCITDGVEADTVIPWPAPLTIHSDCSTGSNLLPPGACAVILDRDYPAAAASVPSSRLPIRAGTILLTVADAELGNGLAGDDGIMLYKGTRTLISRILWCAADTPIASVTPVGGKIVLSEPRSVPEGGVPEGGVPEGFSVVPVSFLFDHIRYGICSDSLTPGFFELLKNNWFAEWKFGPLDTAQRVFPCSLACLKSGVPPQAPVGYSVIFQSAAQTKTAAQGMCTLQGSNAAAAFSLPLDSLSCFLHLTEQRIETVWPIDLSQLWTPASPVKINEIFPRANAGEPEWAELVNVSQMTINLKNWLFGNSEDTAVIASRDCFLAPGDFLVLTSSAGLFGSRYPAKNHTAVPPDWHPLNNYNDTLCLWDAKRNTKERVCWRSEWFGGWTSQGLERVSLSNSGMDAVSWVLAPSPTPGQPNGAIFWRAGAQPLLDAGPLPFTPNGDGRDDVLSIVTQLPAGYSASISIYGFSGKKIRDFSVSLYGGLSARQLFWDGKEDNGSPAPAGPFFVIMEAASAHGTTIVRKKGVLWR